jgi:WD40 repeat protein
MRRLSRFLCIVLVACVSTFGTPISMPAKELPFEVTANIGHSGHITAMAFSRNSRFILSAAEDATLKLWRVGSGQLIRSIDVGSVINSVDFAPDGRTAVTGSNDGVQTWDLETGRLIRTFSGNNDWSKRIGLVGYSSNGTRIVSRNVDREVTVWDAKTGKPISMKMLDTETRLLIDRYTNGGPSDTGNIVTQDNRYKFTVSGDNMNLVNTETDEIVHTFYNQCSDFYPVAISYDGIRLISGNLKSRDAKLKLWDIRSGRLLREIADHEGPATAVAISYDTHLVASGSADNTFRIWSAETGELLHKSSKQEGTILSLAFSPDGQKLLSLNAGDHGRAIMKVREIKTNRLLESYHFESGADRIQRAIFSPDGQSAVATTGEMILWEIYSGRRIIDLDGTIGPPVYAAAFSPDGRRIAVGVHAGIFHILELGSGKRIQSMFHDSAAAHSIIRHLAFSPVGDRVVSSIVQIAVSTSDRGKADVNNIKVWNINTGQLIHTLVGHRDEIVAIGFSEDGRRIVSASMDRTIRVWDAQTGSSLGQMTLLRGSEWLTITPEGYFQSSSGGMPPINLVRGFDVYPPYSAFGLLQRRNLIQRKLMGDESGIVPKLSSKLDRRILRSRRAIAPTTVDLVKPDCMR